MGRPLARWTVGPVGGVGREVLRESVRTFGRLYPEFDRVVCYNHTDPPPEWDALGVPLLDQRGMGLGHPLTGPDADPGEGGSPASGWKLVPPRLRPDAHELWLDNDIVVRERLPEIGTWLSRPAGLISEGLNRIYGVYDPLVRPGLKLCAGFFGLPPGFDFGAAVLGHCARLGGRPLGHYDEQGLVAAVVSNLPDWVLVPQATMTIIEDHHPVPAKFPPAVHFVGANRKDWHRPWRAYKKSRVMLA